MAWTAYYSFTDYASLTDLQIDKKHFYLLKVMHFYWKHLVVFWYEEIEELSKYSMLG